MTEVYVAEAADGDIVGTVTLTFPGSPYVDVGVDNEAGIRMLGVSAAARGQGLGQELVEFCLDRAQAAGCSGMALLTGAKMVAAQRLYPRLGFTRRPERDKTYDTRTFLCYDRAF